MFTRHFRAMSLANSGQEQKRLRAGEEVAFCSRDEGRDRALAYLKTSKLWTLESAEAPLELAAIRGFAAGTERPSRHPQEIAW